jgi:hypothetical protein
VHAFRGCALPRSADHTGTKKSTEDDNARIHELMGEGARMIEGGNPRALINITLPAII